MKQPRPKPERVVRPPRPPGKAGRSCECCSRPRLAADIEAWARARETDAAGRVVTFNAMYTRLQAERIDMPSLGSVLGHLRRCLRRNHITGAPL